MIKTRLEFLNVEAAVKIAYINRQFEAGKAIETYQKALDELKEIKAKIDMEMFKPARGRTQKMSRMALLIEKCNEIYEAHKQELDHSAKNLTTYKGAWYICETAIIEKALMASKIPTGYHWSEKATRNGWKPKIVYPVIVDDEVYDAYRILFK